MLGRVPKLFGVLFIAFAVFFWLLMIRSLLLLLWRQKKLPPFVGTILFSDFDCILRNAFRWFRAKSKSLSVRFVYWSAVLIVLVQLLAWTGFFVESDFALADYFIPWVTRDLGKEPAAIALEVFVRNDPDPANPTSIIPIIEQLEKAGAKAVLVDRRLVLWNTGKEIARTGIAVFGSPPNHHYNAIDGVNDGYFTLDYFRKQIGSIHSLRPYVRWNEPDVILELMRKVRSIPENDRIKRIGNTVLFGDYSIPVARDGTVLLDLNSERYPEQEFYTPVYVSQNRRTGQLQLWHKYTGLVDSLGFPLAAKYGSYFRDKAVFVLWSSGTGFGMPSASSYGESYAKAFESLIERDYLIRASWIHLGLSVALLFLSGLICRFLKPMYAFPLLIVIAVGSFLTGHWLFHVHRLFIEISALLVTTSLAAIVFPAVRFTHDIRDEEKLSDRVVESSDHRTI